MFPNDPQASHIAAFIVPIAETPADYLASGESDLADLTTDLSALTSTGEVWRPREFTFASRTWGIKAPGCSTGPGPNTWSNSATMVDATASDLMVRVSDADTGGAGAFETAEIVLRESLGYGTYVTHTCSRLDALYHRVRSVGMVVMVHVRACVQRAFSIGNSAVNPIWVVC